MEYIYFLNSLYPNKKKLSKWVLGTCKNPIGRGGGEVGVVKSKGSANPSRVAGHLRRKFELFQIGVFILLFLMDGGCSEGSLWLVITNNHRLHLAN